MIGTCNLRNEKDFLKGTFSFLFLLFSYACFILFVFSFKPITIINKKYYLKYLFYKNKS